ncbi:MAG: hypothetical protein ORN50_00300, partial [Crocinitomicaceae bacterium]|nr:hypothetical protein [Crocinitomicaceae bacterium]
MDLRLVTKSFNPRIKIKKNGIPKANKNNNPCSQRGVSKPIGVLIWFKMVFDGKVEENIMTIEATTIASRANAPNTMMKAPNTLAKTPNIL